MNAVSGPLPEAPWGATIGIYFVLVGFASGLSLICWWVRPRDPRSADHFEWVAGWSALLVMLVVCTLLVIDLGRPTRFFSMVTRFSNLGSPMSIGAKLITLKLALLAAYLYLLRRRLASAVHAEPSYSVVPAILGVVSLGLAIYPAVLLSRTWISPLATGPMASLVFLSTALSMGTAGALLVGQFVPGVVDEGFKARMSRMLIFLLAVQAMVLGFDYLSTPPNQTALVSVESFRIVVVLVGLVLPLMIFVAVPNHRAASVLGAVASIAGAGVLRYLVFAVR